MPCAAKSVNTSHLSKDAYKMGEDPVSKARQRGGGGVCPLGGQLHPHSLTSYNTQLPSVIGSPVFHCPVPVVQG